VSGGLLSLNEIIDLKEFPKVRKDLYNMVNDRESTKPV